MATNVELSVTLIPVGTPWVIVKSFGYNEYCQLSKPTTFDIEFLTDSTSQNLVIEHVLKHSNDHATAVIVDSISFFGITDPRFVWAGSYYPDYPEHYPDKISPLPGHGYLGWNGIYQLEFDVPVFTWIHKQLNLGWLYQ